MTDLPQEGEQYPTASTEGLPSVAEPSPEAKERFLQMLLGDAIMEENPPAPRPRHAQRHRLHPAREEHLVTLSAAQCRILSTIAKDLYYLVDHIALFESLTTPQNEQPTRNWPLIGFRSALLSVETFLSDIKTHHKTSGMTVTQHSLPQTWNEAFPDARKLLVEKIGDINKSLAKRCKKPEQARDQMTTGDAKPLLEYLQALDRVHHHLNAHIPLRELDKTSVPSRRASVRDRRILSRFPVVTLLNSLRELKFSDDSLRELSKLNDLQTSIASPIIPSSFVPAETVPDADSLKDTLSAVRQQLLDSISDLPDSVSGLYEEGTLAPKRLGLLIREANQRNSNDDMLNREYIIGKASCDEYEEAGLDIKDYKESFRKLNLCHDIDLTLAITMPVLHALQENAGRQEPDQNQQWQR